MYINIHLYNSIYVIIPLYESPCLTPPLAFVPLPFGLKFVGIVAEGLSTNPVQ